MAGYSPGPGKVRPALFKMPSLFPEPKPNLGAEVLFARLT